MQAIFRRENNIGSYTSKNLIFTFKPIKLGQVFQECTLFFDNQEYTDPIPIIVKGQCVDVPIYVEKLTYNLHILVYEKTFREKIVLHNRASNTMKLQLYYPKELKNYLEFNPTLGYIQGKDKFEIWMKFKPDRTILSVGKKFISEDNSIEIPIKVIGANQVIPVRFKVVGRFTVNSVTFNPPNIDFGNIYHNSESRVNMKMENHSLLPQRFYFANLPKEIKVETDNGCGVLLPGESYKFSVIYRPTQVTVYEEGNIFCRLVTGDICSREVKVNFKANVIRMPLKISKTLIIMPPLPEKESVEIITQIENPTSKTYSVVLIPPNTKLSGLMITPVVMQIQPQKSKLVSIKFNSEFRDFNRTILEEIKEAELKFKKEQEIKGLVTKEDDQDEENNAEENPEPAHGTKKRKRRKRNKKLAERLQQTQANVEEPAADGKKKAPPPAKKEEDKKDAGKKGKKDAAAEEEEEERRKKEEQERIEKEKQRIEELERNFDKVEELKKLGGRKLDFFPEDSRKRAQHYDWYIPLIFRDISKPSTEKPLNSFIVVRTVTVTRTLIPQQEVVDFGEVPVAFRKTFEILVKNISETEQALRMDPLPPYGGFSVLNARRTLAPGDTKPILVEFNPFTQQIFEERLKLFSESTVTSVLLKGIGVRPEVRIEPSDGLIYFGNVLVNEYVEKEFEIQNVSHFPVKFNLLKKKEGILNKKGLSNFTCIPSEGIVKSQSSLSVKVIFHPDRISDHYFQILKLDVPNQVKEQMIYLRGYSYKRQNFIREHDPFIWRELSWFDLKKYEEPLMLREDPDQLANLQEGEEPPEPKIKTITLEFVRADNTEENPFEEQPKLDEQEEPVKVDNGDQNELTEEEREKRYERRVLVGGGRLLDPKLEKNGAFEFNPPGDDPYFECDNPKGVIASGQEVVVTFKFKPPEVDPLLKNIQEVKSIGRWVESIWECKITGGYIEPGEQDLMTYNIKLRAYANQI